METITTGALALSLLNHPGAAKVSGSLTIDQDGQAARMQMIHVAPGTPLVINTESSGTVYVTFVRDEPAAR